MYKDISTSYSYYYPFSSSYLFNSLGQAGWLRLSSSDTHINFYLCQFCCEPDSDAADPVSKPVSPYPTAHCHFLVGFVAICLVLGPRLALEGLQGTYIYAWGKNLHVDI
jgi:hypothetical protein